MLLQIRILTDWIAIHCSNTLPPASVVSSARGSLDRLSSSGHSINMTKRLPTKKSRQFFPSLWTNRVLKHSLAAGLERAAMSLVGVDRVATPAAVSEQATTADELGRVLMLAAGSEEAPISADGPERTMSAAEPEQATSAAGSDPSVAVDKNATTIIDSAELADVQAVAVVSDSSVASNSEEAAHRPTDESEDVPCQDDIERRGVVDRWNWREIAGWQKHCLLCWGNASPAWAW